MIGLRIKRDGVQIPYGSRGDLAAGKVGTEGHNWGEVMSGFRRETQPELLDRSGWEFGFN